MKIADLLNEDKKGPKIVKPKKSSGGVRYNSEVGLMAGFMRLPLEEFDPMNPERTMPERLLGDAQSVYKDIKNLLAPVYDEAMFAKWYNLGEVYGYAMNEKLTNTSRRVTAFGWAGGTNQSESGPSDVEFIGSDVAGVSVKAEGGITLANLTPKTLGLEPPPKEDVFAAYAQTEYLQMKRNVFTEVMNIAKSQPGVPVAALSDAYSVTFNPDTNTFLCKGKKTVDYTADQIMKELNRNATWQRGFGDWFQANFADYKHFADPLFKKVAVAFEKIIEDNLKDSKKLAGILQFAKIPYFYATPKSLYYVPSIDEVEDLEIKGIKYADPDGTSQLFKAIIGRKDSIEGANAELDIYVRYANGMFETNPTVRVQSLKNPQYIAWEKLV